MTSKESLEEEKEEIKEEKHKNSTVKGKKINQ